MVVMTHNTDISDAWSAKRRTRGSSSASRRRATRSGLDVFLLRDDALTQGSGPGSDQEQGHQDQDRDRPDPVPDLTPSLYLQQLHHRPAARQRRPCRSSSAELFHRLEFRILRQRVDQIFVRASPRADGALSVFGAAASAAACSRFVRSWRSSSRSAVAHRSVDRRDHGAAIEAAGGRRLLAVRS